MTRYIDKLKHALLTLTDNEVFYFYKTMQADWWCSDEHMLSKEWTLKLDRTVAWSLKIQEIQIGALQQ